MPPRPRRFVSTDELAYYRAHFREALREDAVVCLECGRLCAALGAHLTLHRGTLDDYREKWGYNRTTAMVSPQLSHVMGDHAVRRNLPSLGPPNAIAFAQVAALKSRSLKRRLEARLGQADRAKARRRMGRASGHKKKVDDATLRAAAAAGGTLREIAARAGLHRNTVKQRLRELGVARPDRRSAQPTVADAELLALRKAGLWYREIAERTGMNVNTVAGRLRKLRQRGLLSADQEPRKRRVDTGALLALARTGLSNREIARRTGMWHGTVGRHLRILDPNDTLPSVRGRHGPKKKVDDATLRALVAEGGTLREIAARAGLHRVYVGKRLRKLGLARADRSPHQHKATDPELLDLVAAGLTNREISARTGMPYDAVSRRLHKLGVYRLGPRRHKVKNADVLALRQAGLSYGKIAERTGLTVKAVGHRLRRLRQRGVDVPHPSHRPPVRTLTPRRG